jgi:hypothetical protein
VSTDSYAVFLDDERSPLEVFWLKLPLPADAWTIVRTFENFADTLSSRGLPSHISFDHDLGNNSDGSVRASGMDCAKWLSEYCLDNNFTVPSFSVHSQNPVGAANIRGLLDGLARSQPQRRPGLAQS